MGAVVAKHIDDIEIAWSKNAIMVCPSVFAALSIGRY
jgi:hypothetical protein